jgi:hypothetical protein
MEEGMRPVNAMCKRMLQLEFTAMKFKEHARVEVSSPTL